MSEVKVGRNDPCPCGSGKKFKKCCGRFEDLLDMKLDAFTRYNQLITAIKIKLDKYYSDKIKRIRKEVQTQFLRFTVDKSLPSEHEAILSDWLWFDKTDNNEPSLGNAYLMENGDYMDKSLHDALKALNQSYLSVYEVESYQDYHLQVRDIFQNNVYQVLLKEPWEIADKHQILLLGRLVTLEEENLFTGMVLMIDAKSSERDFIKQHTDYLCRINNASILNLLKLNGEFLYGIFDHAYKKTLVNINNIQVITAEKSETQALSDFLREDSGWKLVHQLSGFKWFQPDGENRGYIRIAIGEEQILCCADVLEDIIKLDDTLDSIIGEKEAVILSSLFMSRPPALEIADLWFTVIKDQETERWLDTPHPELDDKSPRELLQDEEGRTRLIAMLDEFTQSISTKEEKELIDYMCCRVTG